MEKFGKIYRQTTERTLKNNFEASSSVFIVKYQGINATKLGELRQNLKSIGAKFFVSNNALAKRAVSDNSIGKNRLSEFIDGPVGFIFIKDDPVASSRMLKAFIKENEIFALKGGILDARILDKNDIELLASLPSKDTLIAMVVMGIKSPVTNFVLILNQLLLKLVIVLKAISDKRES